MPGCHNESNGLREIERNAILAMIVRRAPSDDAEEKAKKMFLGFTGPNKDRHIIGMLYDGIVSDVWPWSKIE